MGIISERGVDVLARYFQVALVAGNNDPPDWSDLITNQTVRGHLAVSPRVVVIMTACDMTVPVKVELSDDPPSDDLVEWEHVTEASIAFPSDSLTVTNIRGSDSEGVGRLSLPGGVYRVRAFFGGLNTLSDDELEGDDHYRLVLWPGEEREPTVLKRYEP